MKKANLLSFLLVVSSLVFSGCVVRTYSLTRDRLDQDLSSGNRGYLQGKAPAAEERKSTRTTQVVEVEIGSPIKFEKAPKPKPVETNIMPAAEKSETQGNRGYITESISPEINEPSTQQALGFEKYTVQKNDTLQKISQKFYSTSRKWKKIYDANKDVLKGPNKVYPGQVLNIPAASETKKALKEPTQNLK